jgi:hypothetical protein
VIPIAQGQSVSQSVWVRATWRSNTWAVQVLNEGLPSEALDCVAMLQAIGKHPIQQFNATHVPGATEGVTGRPPVAGKVPSIISNWSTALLAVGVLICLLLVAAGGWGRPEPLHACCYRMCFGQSL